MSSPLGYGHDHPMPAVDNHNYLKVYFGRDLKLAKCSIALISVLFFIPVYIEKDVSSIF